MNAGERCPLHGDSRIGERDVLANGPVEEHVLFKTTPIYIDQLHRPARFDTP